MWARLPGCLVARPTSCSDAGSPLYSLLPDLLRFASLSCLQPSPSITPPPAAQVGASQCPVLHAHAAACPG